MVREVVGFREYLRCIPDELLESVSEDYVWLCGMRFGDGRRAEFVNRRECCREECARRGAPQLYRMAESVIAPWAA